MLKKSKITKGKLISMLYDYAKIHKQPSVRITFQGRRVNLYLGNGRKNYYDLTMQQAYEQGFKPSSRIRSSDLRQNDFCYSVAFFRCLVHNWDIKPKEMHHTSAARRITAFYDGSVIRYIVSCCNLELLHRIYKEKITVEQAIQERGIRYAKARILDTLLGGRSGKVVSADCLLCDNLLLLSSKLCVRLYNPAVEIKEVFDEQSENMKNENLEKLAVELMEESKNEVPYL